MPDKSSERVRVALICSVTDSRRRPTILPASELVGYSVLWPVDSTAAPDLI
ncbi:MAG: hypothetical protein RL107_124 [Actinomycetota bacterium]|jgi:hypothetical protein